MTSCFKAVGSCAFLQQHTAWYDLPSCQYSSARFVFGVIFLSEIFTSLSSNSIHAWKKHFCCLFWFSFIPKWNSTEIECIFNQVEMCDKEWRIIVMFTCTSYFRFRAGNGASIASEERKSFSSPSLRDNSVIIVEVLCTSTRVTVS